MLYEKRIESLQRSSIFKEVDFLILDDTDSLFYFSGLKLSAGVLIITQSDVVLLVDGRYFDAAKEKSPWRVANLKEDELAEIFCAYGANLSKRIGFNSQKTSYRSFQKLQDFITRLKKQKRVIEFQLVALDQPARHLQMVKDSEEIQAMKKAAKLNWKGFEHICTKLEEGVTEEFLALEFEIYCRKNGAERLSFQPIIAFGENTAYPHHITSQARLKKNDVVLIDIGLVVDEYCSDMTRMIFFGEGHAEIEKFYSMVRKAHNKVLAMCHPGMRIGALDSEARRVLEEVGYAELFTHGLGHGIGLQVHEPPIVKSKGEDKDVILKPGMVFTVEPGVYKAGVGGARYEDMILITQDGYENFYSSI